MATRAPLGAERLSTLRRCWAVATVAVVVLAGCAGPPEPSATPAVVPATPRGKPAPRVTQAPATPSPTVSATTSPTPASTVAEATGGVYLAIGDSITFGVGVPQPRRNGYVARVADALAGAARPITETRVFAVPGETATGFLDRRLDDVVTAIEELGPRVQLVTIGLGANELLRARREPACEADPEGDACALLVDRASLAATDALRTIVTAIQASLDANGAAPRVALLAYYNPDARPVASSAVAGPDGKVACLADDPAPGLDDRIACVAQERAVTLVDLHAAFRGREAELTRIRAGDVHPNTAGYGVIAEEILAALGG